MVLSPALPVAVPLLAAALLSGLRQYLPRRVADSFSIATAAFNLVFTIFLLRAAWRHPFVYWFGDWYPGGHVVLGICFVVDPIGAGLAVLAALLAMLALLFSWRFLECGHNLYHPLMLVFLAAMSGFVLTGDMFNMFVFFELMSTAAFALCGLKTAEPAPLQGAFNFAITNTIAAFLVLTGIAFLYGATGALNLAQIGSALGTRRDSLIIVAFLFITCGFLIKAAAVPFHFWLPDAHAVAPTPVCVLFSGLMVELGLYAVMRVYATVFQHAFAGHIHGLRVIFVTIGVVTAVWGGFMCYAEHHLKRMLAFSTISHMGLMIIGFGLQSAIGLAGLCLYLIAHALAKSGLFFTAGILLHRLRSMSENVLFGRGRELRFTAILWMIGGLALAGMPPCATFLGESLISGAGEKVGYQWISVVFIVAGAFTGGAVFRVGMRTFAGWGDQGPSDRSSEIDELPETHEENKIIYWFLFAPATCCILGCLAVSFVPALRVYLEIAATRFLDQSAYIRLVYTGGWSTQVVSPASSPLLAAGLRGSAATLVALLLALASVFHLYLPRSLRWPSHIEGPMRPFRALQSGHPGDYVTWLTVGVSTLGGALYLLLR